MNSQNSRTLSEPVIPPGKVDWVAALALMVVVVVVMGFWIVIGWLIFA